MIIEVGDTRRPPQLTVNRYMARGKKMYDEWYDHYEVNEDGVKVYGRRGKRFETWVEKDYFDSIHVEEGLLPSHRFMFRMYGPDYDWGILWSGARAILKETVEFDGRDYYCIVFECSSMVNNHVDKKQFMDLYESGMPVLDIIKKLKL